jgi:putative ABC transport system substrate-binding protein
MIAVSDPVGQGLVTSLARPGGNVTGVAWGAGSELMGKTLEIIKETIPKVKQVALLGEGPGTSRGNQDFDDTSRRLGLKSARFAVETVTEVEPMMAEIRRRNIDVVYVPLRGFLFNERHRVAALAVARGIPTL